MDRDALNELSRKVLGAALCVHTELGRGLLESAYKACLAYELTKAGFAVQTEVPVPVIYDGTKLTDVGYRMDLLVAGELVVVVKALEAIAPVHCAQLVSYLKLFGQAAGLLLNFNVVRLQDGIFRRVNGL